MARQAAYTARMDEKARQQVALFRISVLGPLVGARLEHGELVELCREAASRAWELPSGEVIELSARTIEDWFYLYQHAPVRQSARTAPSPAIVRLIRVSAISSASRRAAAST